MREFTKADGIVMSQITERSLGRGYKFFTSSFRADILNIKRAVNDALAYYDRSFDMMDDSTRLELKIVLNELLINAVKHGGKAGGKPGAANYIKAVAGMASVDRAFLIIEDDGDGYDTTRVSRRRAGSASGGGIDDIEETGRGIYIVKSLCEDFMVNEKGNKVVITKRLRTA